MKRALIYLDPDEPTASLQLVEVIRQMYGDRTYRTVAVAVAASVPKAIGAVDRLILIAEDHVDRYDTQSIVAAIAELHRKQRFDAIVISATTFGRMLAPRLAMRLHVGLVADVTEIRRSGDRVQLVRPAFSGRMLAAIEQRGDAPIMASIRPDTFTRRPSAIRATDTEVFVPRSIGAPRVRLLSRTPKASTVDIRASDVLVSGGGGVMRHFDKLAALAHELGGMVSASRHVVDRGKAPRDIQVGQSGKTVSPRLYLAVGISGSIQHVVGIKTAEYVIAVNKDRQAPICALADIVVQGDAREFIDRIVGKIRANRAAPDEPQEASNLSQTDGGDR